VTRANTVVLGLGYPTIIPDNGVTPMQVADVDGVKIAGLLFDAGTTNSPNLLQVGPAGSSASHAGNPTTIQDVFFRIGGAGAGKATNSLLVNSNNTIIDHIWAWRADHGAGVGWTVNTADTGLIVNGDNVTAYGLFVEHYQKYEVIWNGNKRRADVFFQNEMPYDPPNQAAWAARRRQRATPPTRWPTTSPATRPGAWAATATSTSTRPFGGCRVVQVVHDRAGPAVRAPAGSPVAGRAPSAIRGRPGRRSADARARPGGVPPPPAPATFVASTVSPANRSPTGPRRRSASG
jgi:hypothetical protein